MPFVMVTVVMTDLTRKYDIEIVSPVWTKRIQIGLIQCIDEITGECNRKFLKRARNYFGTGRPITNFKVGVRVFLSKKQYFVDISPSRSY